MHIYVAIACFFGAAVAAPFGGYEVAAIDSYSIPRYEFNYAVNDPHTGDNKAQSEVRDGNVVKGSYSLAEPDGTVRVVDYTADDVRGFNAVVKRIGNAVHPQTIQAPVVKQIIQPIAYEPIAPIAPFHGNSYHGNAYHGNAYHGNAYHGNAISYSSNILGFGGLNGFGLNNGYGQDIGLGLNSLNLGGLGYGGWKH